MISRKYTTKHITRRKLPVKFIILHHTAGKFPSDVSYLCNNDRKVSCDFYINRKGEVFQLNPNVAANYTNHAGESYYQSFYGLNKYSIGIEMEHLTLDSNWPKSQVIACGNLCKQLLKDFKLDIDTSPITSHKKIAIPTGRKMDPHEFDWELFSKTVRA